MARGSRGSLAFQNHGLDFRVERVERPLVAVFGHGATTNTEAPTRSPKRSTMAGMEQPASE